MKAAAPEASSLVVSQDARAKNPSESGDRDIARRFRQASRLMGALSISIGATVLVGWAAGIPILLEELFEVPDTALHPGDDATGTNRSGPAPGIEERHTEKTGSAIGTGDLD